MHNIKLKIAYDGTEYLGWQKTREGPSIEATLEKIISQILQEPVYLQAASRTDAGVHAHGQIVNFLATKQQIDLKRLQISLNQLLPKDIVVLETENAAPHFHPTLDAIGKEYRYSLCMGSYQFPEHRLYSWHCYLPINLDFIREAISYFLGEKDFAAFCNVQKNRHYDSTIRRLNEITITEVEDNRLLFTIKGDHFLYKMVRNIVGTLVYVGQEKLPVSAIKEIISGKQRPDAGVTAPAHGLTLHTVFYDV